MTFYIVIKSVLDYLNAFHFDQPDSKRIMLKYFQYMHVAFTLWCSKNSLFDFYPFFQNVSH